MKRTVYLLAILVVCAASCGPGKAGVEPVGRTRFSYPPEIPIDTLHARGIAPINATYKRQYFRLMPYMFLNRFNEYRGIKGDFFSITYAGQFELYMAVEYWGQYGEHRNAINFLVARPLGSQVPLKDATITVSSIKHGVFQEVDPLKGPYTRDQQRRMFVAKLSFETEAELLALIRGDVVQIHINGQEYLFLNPEYVPE